MSTPTLAKAWMLPPEKLSPDPLRSVLLAPDVATSALGPVLSPETTSYLNLLQQDGTELEDSAYKDLIKNGDETTLFVFIKSVLGPANNFNASLTYALLQRLLTDALNRGEIWSPLLDVLSNPATVAGGYSYRDKTVLWSEDARAQTTKEYPALPPLPTPKEWLLNASFFTSKTNPDEILDKIKNYHKEPWLPVLATTVSTVTPRLVDQFITDQPSLLPLVARLTDEDSLGAIAHGVLNNFESSNYHKLSDYSNQGSIHVELAIFNQINKQLGRLPQSVRDRLESISPPPTPGSKKKIDPTFAQVFLMTDTSLPVSYFEPFLNTDDTDELLPLLGHPEFAELYQEEILKKAAAHMTRYSYRNSNIVELILPNPKYHPISCHLDEPVMLNLAKLAVHPEKLTRKSETIIRVIQHPSATLPVLTYIANECEMIKVRVALAQSPKARASQDIRNILLRSRSAEVVKALLQDATQEDFLDLWQKLIESAPSTALDLLESGSLPEGLTVPRLTIAPLFKSEDKALRERALKVSPKLGNNTLTARQLKKAKTTQLK